MFCVSSVYFHSFILVILWHCQTSRINRTLCCLFVSKYWYKRLLFLYSWVYLFYFAFDFVLFCLCVKDFSFRLVNVSYVLSIVPQRQTCLQRLLSIYVFVCVMWFPSLPFVDLKSSGSLPQAFPEFHKTLPWLLDFWRVPIQKLQKKEKKHIFDYWVVPVHIQAGWRNVNSQKLFPKRIVFKNI